MINPEQLEMITVDMLVSVSHTYRKVMKVLDFKKITKSVKSKEREKAVGAIGFTPERLTTCLVLQFMKDVSDREFERVFIREQRGKMVL